MTTDSSIDDEQSKVTGSMDHYQHVKKTISQLFLTFFTVLFTWDQIFKIQFKARVGVLKHEQEETTTI